MQYVLPLLPKGGPEERAVEAGEIDAIIDYPGSNVFLLPAARRALRAASRDAARTSSIANGLLAALPRAEYQRLIAGLEPLTLKSGEVLHEPGVPIQYVYFPVDSVISLLAQVEGDRALEVGAVGREGMVGVALALGSEVSSVRALVQGTGTAMRMKAARFICAFEESPPLRREVYRYAHTKLTQARQTVACNCFHSVEGRLARWLLTSSDRVSSEEFLLTQAFLARMLGVRRATVNEAAGPLQQRKLITCSHGRIRILDRKGLEAAACGCYAAHKPMATALRAAGSRRSVSFFTTP